MFNMFRNAFLFRDLRYLSLSRCKLCQGFILPALTTYLNEDENLVRFSFVLNNQSKPLFAYLVEDPAEAKARAERKRAVTRVDRFTTSVDRQVSETGFESDLDIIQILDAATLHPRMEVIQIV